jgi:hypothetical protein
MLPAPNQIPSSLFALDPNWIILDRPTIASGAPGSPSVTVSLALLHPTSGIALLDLAPAWTPNAVACLHQTLIAARLGLIYSVPPILYRQINPAEMDDLAGLMTEMFTQEPRITGNPAWTYLALRILAGTRVLATVPATLPTATLKPALHRQPRLAVEAASAFLIACGIAGAAYLAIGPVSHPPPPLEVPQPLSPAVDQSPAQSPPAPSPPAALSPLVVKTLVAQGNARAATHDISAARRYYEIAANGGSWEAAIAMGRTFDPAYLQRTHPAHTLIPDRPTAARWYDVARRIGGADAAAALRDDAEITGSSQP